jgi:hypothetical protein
MRTYPSNMLRVVFNLTFRHTLSRFKKQNVIGFVYNIMFFPADVLFPQLFLGTIGVGKKYIPHILSYKTYSPSIFLVATIFTRHNLSLCISTAINGTLRRDTRSFSIRTCLEFIILCCPNI